MNHRNRIREAVENGDAVLGARCMTRSPVFVEVYGDLGLDFVWIDFEHGGASPYDATMLEELVRTAEGAGIDLLVRIPTGDPPLVRKALDAGVRTLLVPRVETAAEVRRAVRASRFRYDGDVGDRGVGTGRPAGWGADLGGYPEREDGSVLVGAMIENRTALSNLDDILAVPDLGFVFVGPADLSVSFGRPLETDHPDVRGAIDRVREACLDAGVPAGRIASDADDAAAALDAGYRIVRIGGEVAATRQVLGGRLAELRE